ncbi:MAG: 4a-hydroxytetrahydrobiopterin dehydratase [Pseudomonadota bacterium]
MNELSREKCDVGGKDAVRLGPSEVTALLGQLSDWRVVQRDGIDQLEKGFVFSDFTAALSFTNQVGRLAEEENHHPSILTEWGKVTVTWWSHSLGGLHRNDFIMAAKTDVLNASVVY